MSTVKLTKSIIEAAIAGFEAQKTNIDDQIAELKAMLTGTVSPEKENDAAPVAGTRRKFSAAARRRMKEAQKLRWAKIKGEAAPQEPAPAAKSAKATSAATKKAAPGPAPKQKRKLSAAGRAAIIAATKKMWAAKRAAAKQA